jgi:hypothetical protein
MSLINAPNLPALIVQRSYPTVFKAVPIKLDFSATGIYTLDYSNMQALTYLDSVQTLWVDNFGNAQILKITIPSTQQVLQIAAGLQRYIPVLCANPVKMIFESTGGTVQQVTLCNFPVFTA